jgi:hypothetical protein
MIVSNNLNFNPSCECSSLFAGQPIYENNITRSPFLVACHVNVTDEGIAGDNETGKEACLDMSLVSSDP